VSGYDQAVQAAKAALHVHGGMPHLLPPDEFDCCVEEIVTAAVPVIRRQVLEEAAEIVRAYVNSYEQAGDNPAANALRNVAADLAVSDEQEQEQP
jgi:hypothetical protein